MTPSHFWWDTFSPKLLSFLLAFENHVHTILVCWLHLENFIFIFLFDAISRYWTKISITLNETKIVNQIRVNIELALKWSTCTIIAIKVSSTLSCHVLTFTLAKTPAKQSLYLHQRHMKNGLRYCQWHSNISSIVELFFKLTAYKHILTPTGQRFPISLVCFPLRSLFLWCFGIKPKLRVTLIVFMANMCFDCLYSLFDVFLVKVPTGIHIMKWSATILTPNLNKLGAVRAKWIKWTSISAELLEKLQVII